VPDSSDAAPHDGEVAAHGRRHIGRSPCCRYSTACLKSTAGALSKQGCGGKDVLGVRANSEMAVRADHEISSGLASRQSCTLLRPSYRRHEGSELELVSVG
jgi:hypothetical protein